MEFNSVILMEHKNLEALSALQNPKSLDLSAIDAVEASRYRMILTMAQSMFENNFQQAQQGVLSNDFYLGSVVKNIENYAERRYRVYPMSSSFGWRLSGFLAKK